MKIIARNNTKECMSILRKMHLKLSLGLYSAAMVSVFDPSWSGLFFGSTSLQDTEGITYQEITSCVVSRLLLRCIFLHRGRPAKRLLVRVPLCVAESSYSTFTDRVGPLIVHRSRTEQETSCCQCLFNSNLLLTLLTIWAECEWIISAYCVLMTIFPTSTKLYSCKLRRRLCTSRPWVRHHLVLCR